MMAELEAELANEIDIIGEVSAGGMILNDYLLKIQKIEGGHRLIATRGSEVQTMDVLDGQVMSVNGKTGEVVLSKKDVMLDISGSALGVLHLTGDTAGMSKDNAVELDYSFRITVDTSTNDTPKYEVLAKEGKCDVKWQGSSSLNWPKKNYTIKFDNEFIAKKGWGAQKKYCFKANYIDATQARNIIGARLWAQVVRSRSDYETAVPDLIKNSPNMGAIDGFPVIITINGTYAGLYTWNIPKDGWMFGMSGKTATECVVSASGAAAYYPANEANPVRKGFSSSDMREQYTWEEAQPEGTPGYYGYPFPVDYWFELEHSSFANEIDARSSLNAMIGRIMGHSTSPTGGAYDAEIEKYIDINSVIDWICFGSLIGAYDCITKNYILYTADGTKWHMSMYDMDSTFGLWADGKKTVAADDAKSGRLASFKNNNKAGFIAAAFLMDRVRERYAELRNGVLSTANVANVIEQFIKEIPAEEYERDRAIWTSVPSTSVSTMSQMIDWYQERVKICDADFGVGIEEEVRELKDAHDKLENEIYSGFWKDEHVDGSGLGLAEGYVHAKGLYIVDKSTLFVYSTIPLQLNAGDIVCVNTQGYQDIVSIISANENGKWVSLVACKDDVLREYAYTAPRDMEVYLSLRKTNYQVVVKRSILPTASETVKGGVKIGPEFVMDGDRLRLKEKGYELIETININDTDIVLLTRNKEPDGTPYAFKKMIIKMMMNPAQSYVYARAHFYGDAGNTETKLSILMIAGMSSNTTIRNSICELQPQNGWWSGSSMSSDNNEQEAVEIFAAPMWEMRHTAREIPTITKVNIDHRNVAMAAGSVIKIYGVKA